MNDPTVILLCKIALAVLLWRWVYAGLGWIQETGWPWVRRHHQGTTIFLCLVLILVAVFLVIGFFYNVERLRTHTGLISEHSKTFSHNTKVIAEQIDTLNKVVQRLEKQTKAKEKP